MSPHAALPATALNALLQILGPGWIEIVAHKPGQPGSSSWFELGPPGMRPRVIRLIEQLDMRYSAEVTISLPRHERGWGTVRECMIVWARVEGGDQTKRARAFRPLPTLVLREGASSRRLLIWALDRPLPWEWAKRANRRVAYRLGARQNVSDPDELAINAPGTCIRVGRKRPAPVVVARLTDDIWTPAQIVGKDRPAWPRPLRDPPDVDWREIADRKRATG